MINPIRAISACTFLFSSFAAVAQCMDRQIYNKQVSTCNQQDALQKKAEYECATAGNIDRCIQIKM